jgi:hypothetical protein
MPSQLPAVRQRGAVRPLWLCSSTQFSIHPALPADLLSVREPHNRAHDLHIETQLVDGAAESVRHLNQQLLADGGEGGKRHEKGHAQAVTLRLACLC